MNMVAAIGMLIVRANIESYVLSALSYELSQIIVGPAIKQTLIYAVKTA